MNSKTLILFILSLAFLPTTNGEETASKFSLTVRWTPVGGGTVETKVPDVALLVNDRLQVPVARGAEDQGDPTWNLNLNFYLEGRNVVAELSDHARFRVAQDGQSHPDTIARATFALVWNEEVVIFDSGHGKLSFVAGLEGPAPEFNRDEKKSLPDDLAEKLEFAYKSKTPGNFVFDVYNPTEYGLQGALIRVTAPASEGHAEFDRVYKIGLRCPPFGDGRDNGINIPKLAEYPEGTPVKITLEKVF